MVISKGSYVYGELKNVLYCSVQKMHIQVRGQKIPRYMGGRIGVIMEKCETSCTPIPMVPRLDQSYGYIKGKLRVWRAQNCNALVGAENTLISVGPKNSFLHGMQHRSDDGKMRNLMHPNPNGTALAPKQWLYQREAT